MGRVITDATKMKFDCVKELVRVLKINGYQHMEIIYQIVKHQKCISIEDISKLARIGKKRVRLYAEKVRSLKGLYILGDWCYYKDNISLKGIVASDVGLKTVYTKEEAEERIRLAQEYNILTQNISNLNIVELIWVHNAYVSKYFYIDELVKISNLASVYVENFVGVLSTLGLVERIGKRYKVIRDIPLHMTTKDIILARKDNIEQVSSNYIVEKEGDEGEVYKPKSIIRKDNNLTKINGFSYPELFLYIESFGLKGEEKDILRRAVFASAGISEKNIVFS